MPEPKPNPVLAFHGVYPDGHVDVITNADVVFSLSRDEARDLARHILRNTRNESVEPGADYVFADWSPSEGNSGIIVDYGTVSYLGTRMGQRLFFRESVEIKPFLHAVHVNDIVAYEDERDA